MPAAVAAVTRLDVRRVDTGWLDALLRRVDLDREQQACGKAMAQRDASWPA